MKVLKNILKSIYYNKCTIAMILLSAFSAYSLFIMLNISLWLKIVISVCILSIGILCSINIGWETTKEIDERVTKARENRKIKAEEREKRLIEKQKDKEIKKIVDELKVEEEKRIQEENEKQMKNFEANVQAIALQKYEEAQKAVSENKQVENKVEDVNIDSNEKPKVEAVVDNAKAEPMQNESQEKPVRPNEVIMG